jgi:hypothetical protein
MKPYKLHYTVLGPRLYRLEAPIAYHSTRYGKTITVEAGFRSDGSTGWLDMASRYWWVHDKLCTTYRWDDGSRCSRWQGSMVLGDLAREDRCWVAGTAGVFVTWVGGLFSAPRPR